ncbi:MAG: PAS domain S-box protein, partial [Verrucomicrobiales bacterium]
MIAGVALVYVLTARLGLLLAMSDGVVTAVWPPSGVALAAMLIIGRRVWPGIWFGSFVANLWPLLARTSSPGIFTALLVSMIFATGSLGAAWFATWALDKRSQMPQPESGVRQIGAFLLFGGALGCLISSSVGATTLCLSGLAPMAALPGIWLTWWMGDALGVILFTPVLLVWLRRENWSRKIRLGESVFCFSVIIGLAWFVFTARSPRFFGGATDDFILLPLMVWVALRLGYRGTTVALIIVGIIAILTTANGCGPYVRPSLNESLLCLDLFLLCLVTTGLCISAVVQERKNAEVSLAAANQELEDRVQKRTESLKTLADRWRSESENHLLAAEALRTSELQHRLISQIIVSFSFAYLVAPDRSVKLEWITPGVTDVIGYSEADLKGAVSFRSRIHPEDRETYRAALDKVMAGSPETMEFRFLTKSGEQRWLQCCNRAEWSPVENRVVRICGATQDITDRKKIERRICAYARLAQELNNADTLREASQLMTDVADELIGWDAAVLVMFDEDTGLCRSVLNTDTVDGKKTDVLSDLDDRQPTRQMRKIIEHGAELILRRDPASVTEGFTLFGNSSRRSASLMYVPIRDGKRTVGMLSIQSYALNAYKQADLDTLQSLADQCAATLARIRSRELQRESQERLALSSHAANIGHWDWNTVTNHAEYSDGWLSQLGYARGELDGHVDTWKSLLHPEDKDNVIGMGYDYAEGRTHEYKTEMRMRHKNGSYRWIMTQGKLLKNSEGKTDRMVGCHIDITERKESEIENARILSLLQATLESNPDGLLVVDTHGKVTLYNQRFAELWRIPKELLALKDDSALLNFVLAQIANPEVFLAGVRSLCSSPDAKAFDTLLCKDDRIIERFSQPQKIGDKIVGRVWNFRDVTERKQMESSLRLTQFSIDRAVDSVFWVAPNGEIIYVNDAACRTLGYPREEMVGRTVSDIDSNFPAEAWPAHWEDVKRRKSFSFESDHRKKDGTAIRTEVTVNYIEFEGREYNCAIMRDITARKVAEAAFRESENNLRAVLNYAPIGIWMQNSTGRTLFVNQTFCNAVGIPEERFVAAPHYAELFAPEVAASCMASDRKALASTEPHLSHERLQLTDGKMHDLEIVKVRLTEKSHGVNGLIGLSLDITARKESEFLLANQKRVLELIASGTALSQTLTELCHAVETQCPGARCSILLLDEDGLHLRHGAAPSLPDSYNKAVDGLAIGSSAGSCGTAAHRRQPVIVTDIATDPLWSAYKETMSQYSMKSCWSTPVFDTKHCVVGTFAVYRDTVGSPAEQDFFTIQSATHTAAIAIEKQRDDDQLARSSTILRRLSVSLLETQETERRHLARELHDEVGQTLTATKLILESLKHQAATNGNSLLTNATDHVDHLLKMVRNLSLNLRPPMLDDFGLVSAMRWLLDQHAQTTDRVVEFDADYTVEHPDPTLETACFRIAQEAITNITRYSQARKVSVTLRTDA